MLKVVELLHRWTGGLIGLLLAVLGLSGAILVHESAWITLPHANDPPTRDVAQLSATVTKLMSRPGHAAGVDHLRVRRHRPASAAIRG